MMPLAVAKRETTVMLGSPLTWPTRSRGESSHQSISPRRNAADAENGSKVSHSTRSKLATFGPAVNPQAVAQFQSPGQSVLLHGMALDHLRLRLPLGVDAIERIEHEICRVSRRPCPGDDRVQYR